SYVAISERGRKLRTPPRVCPTASISRHYASHDDFRPAMEVFAAYVRTRPRGSRSSLRQSLTCVIELAVPGQRASLTLKQGRLLAYAILSAIEEAQDGSVVAHVR